MTEGRVSTSNGSDPIVHNDGKGNTAEDVYPSEGRCYVRTSSATPTSIA